MQQQNEALEVVKEACETLHQAIALLVEGDEPAAANLIILAIGRLEYALDLLPPADKPGPDPGPSPHSRR